MAESPKRTGHDRERDEMPSGISDENVTGRAMDEEQEEFEDTEDLDEEDLDESDR